jgi:peptide/nickel transport system substrate-binding protein
MENLEVTLSTSEGIWEGAMDAAVLYSERAKKAGINLKINKVPNDGYWKNVWLKNPFCAAYWNGRSTEDWMFTQAYSAGATWNASKWNHPRFNKLLLAARGELDENKARDMYWEMQQHLRDEGGTVIPIFSDFLIAHSEKLANNGKIAGNRDLDGFSIIERWWFA